MNEDIWIYDLERDIPSRLTFNSDTDNHPVWTPDGERIVFGSYRGEEFGLYWKASDGTGQVELLITGANPLRPESFSPDGSRLVYREEFGRGRGSDLHVLSMDDLSSQPLLATEFDEEGAAISPDGRWIAITSNETGTRETYVRPFPNVDDGKWQISVGGGSDKAWGPDGSELFYSVLSNAGATIMVVEVETAPVFSAGSPRVLL